MLYTTTQQKMGFHLVFFWVLWSILVLQKLPTVCIPLFCRLRHPAKTVALLSVDIEIWK